MLKLKQLGLFLAMLITITLLVVVIFVLEWHIAIKIVLSIALILLSVIEFTFANVKRENEEVIEVKEEIVDNNKIYQQGHLRCPKCYKPFDGITCFNCGFKRKE